MTRRTAWGTYVYITRVLRQRLTDGTYAPGARLPSEAALCAEFGVVRSTVRRALSALQAEGLITVRTGVGRFAQAPDAPPRTLAEHIAANLRRQIETGRFQAGDALPSEKQLARRHGVSRSTARAALITLETAGLVTCVHGKGRYVSQDVPRRALHARGRPPTSP